MKLLDNPLIKHKIKSQLKKDIKQNQEACIIAVKEAAKEIIKEKLERGDYDQQIKEAIRETTQK